VHGQRRRDFFPLKDLNFDPFQLKLHLNCLFHNLENLFCLKVEFFPPKLPLLLGPPCFLGFLRLLFRSFIHDWFFQNASVFWVLFLLFTRI
jgi:hypothetical protein